MNRNTTSFMVMKFDLTTELNGFDGLSDLGAGNTIVFTEIPAGVDVWFAVDSNSQNKIKALQGMQVQTEHGAIFFTTIGTSSSMMEIAHWASDDMKIVPPPISTFDSLSSFGASAIYQMAKAFNPYENGVLSGGNGSSTSWTNLLSKTLACDSIDLSLFAYEPSSPTHKGLMKVTLDGLLVLIAGSYNDAYGNAPYVKGDLTINDVRGKTLVISGIVSIAGVYQQHYTLIEKQLKA